MAKKYRRRKTGSDTWHFCTNCHLWPTSNYEETTIRPSHDLCNHCRAKEDNNNCSS